LASTSRALAGASRGGRRTLAAAAAAKAEKVEPLKEDWTTSLYQASTITKSVLPNGVACVSTGPSAAKMVGVVFPALPPTLGFAARQMAFKSTNGHSDIKTQRDLEVASCIPYYHQGKVHSMVCVDTTFSAAPSAVAAAALAVGCNREALIGWEWEETLHTIKAQSDLALVCELDAAIHAAAFGGESIYGVPVAEGVGKLSSTDVDAAMAGTAASPLTVVGLGFSHSDLLAFVTWSLAALPARSAVPAAAPKFVAGGLCTVKGTSAMFAAAVPAPADVLLAKVVAAAATYSGAPVAYSAAGIFVLQAPSAALAKVAFSAVTLSDAAVLAAKAKVKTDTLNATGAALVELLATGFEPAAFAAACDAVKPSDVHAAFKAAAAVDAAVAAVVV